MQTIFQSAKRLISICLVTIFIVTSALTISSAPALAGINNGTSNLNCDLDCGSTTSNITASNKEMALGINNDDMMAIATIISTTASAVGAGSIVVAHITAPAAGVLGVLGLTATTTVALPVAGVVATGGLITYGAYKVYNYLKEKEDVKSEPAG